MSTNGSTYANSSLTPRQQNWFASVKALLKAAWERS